MIVSIILALLISIVMIIGMFVMIAAVIVGDLGILFAGGIGTFAFNFMGVCFIFGTSAIIYFIKTVIWGLE